MSIDDWRQKIDGLDEKIVRLIAERMRIAGEIGRTKNSQNRNTEDKARERVVLDNISRIASEEKINADDIKNIYKQVIAACKKIQDNIN